MSKLLCEYADCTNLPRVQCDSCGSNMCFSHILIDKDMKQLDSDNFKIVDRQGHDLCFICAE
jgi:CO dehydrogenase/acetyl-CoA synthase gamma subunit (corrinoid Fe-S protein)